jgi:hypothetical protein
MLSNYGLTNEAKILLRSLVEDMFLITAISKNKGYSEKIVEQDIYTKLKSFKATKRNIDAGILKTDESTLRKIEREIEEIKKKISKRNVKEINKRDIARAADLESYYDTIYHMLSSTVHINPRVLEQYLELTEEGKFKEIKWEVAEDEIEVVLFASVEIMISIFESISQVFKIDLKGNWESIHKAYLAIGRKHQDLQEKLNLSRADS